MRIFARIVLLVAAACGIFLLPGCQPEKRPAAPLPDLRIGIAPFTQPTSTLDLLAGYIAEDQGKISPESLISLDDVFADILRTTKRAYTFIKSEGVVLKRKNGDSTAFDHWVNVAKANNVDLLIVPMVIDWHQRDGGEMGVRDPAEVKIDFFLFDARDSGQLLQRSHFSEKQKDLASNMLNVNTFIKRGGKWLTAEELTREAMLKAAREFGL
jgi:hypothetical protein